MKSLKKIADLADIFEFKLKYAQVPISGEDPKSVTADAFFGPYREQEFSKWILKPSSAFLSSIPENVGAQIGAKVDTNSGVAEFLVKLVPGKGAKIAPGATEAVKAALIKDFTTVFGKDPVSYQKERLSKPPNDPNALKRGIVSSFPVIIDITL